MVKKLSKQKYNQLKRGQIEASKNNDYSKMIIMGSLIANAMKEYEQNNLCNHPDVKTIGGQDYCAVCGKTW